MRGQIGKVDCRISSPLWCLYGDASTRVGETDGDVTEAADGRAGGRARTRVGSSHRGRLSRYFMAVDLHRSHFA